MIRWLIQGVAFAAFQAAPAIGQQGDGFVLGAQTHFKQGWSIDLLDKADSLGAMALRDEIDWARVEREKGVYDFSAADMYMRPMLDRGFRPLLVINETNPLYDLGETPHTDDGRAGFAAFISAILSHYGVDKVRIEIGNEVNSKDFFGGPAAADPPRFFAAITRAVDARLQVDHPGARFSCSGLNVVGIGYYRAFFRYGGLLSCDAISVHPYRDHPETLRAELDRLKALMREFGGEKPIEVTEFGHWFDDPQAAPDYMFKMVSAMAAADVTSAYWYALRDEEWWPNMGLLTLSGQNRKPAAAAYSFLQQKILPLGRPVRLGNNPTVHIYRFGAGQAHVVWGSGGAFSVEGAVSFFDTQGREIDPVTTLSDTPVIIWGEGVTFRVPQPVLIADNMYEYGQHPWSYYALRPDVGLTPLEIVDGNWTSTRGAPDLSPLQIGDVWVTTARFAGVPFAAVERFTASASGTYRIEANWQVPGEDDEPQLRILHNRTQIMAEKLTRSGLVITDMTVTLSAGDTLDFEVAPAEPDGTGAVQRRIRIIGPSASN
tara:strand:- start:187 stop:1821 length:1635 start_codon:yes stop_codon:yes gene_type:complete